MEIQILATIFACMWLADGASGQCDDGWMSGLGHCYLFVNTSKLDWNHASAACHANNAELAFFDTMAELTWFRGQLANKVSYAFWTGLNIASSDFSTFLRGQQWTWGSYRAVNVSLINSGKFWNKSPAAATTTMPLCAGINIQGRLEDMDCNTTQLYACGIHWGGDGSCPRRWIVTDRGCVWLSSLDEQQLTWSQAKDRCYQMDQADGAQLLTITSVEGANFIKMAIPNLNLATTHVFWTGLASKGSNFAWDSGDRYDPTFVHWAVEPDHVAGQEKCGAIRYSGYFSDRNCSQPLNYVCKK